MNLFNKVFVLAKGGVCIYSGRPEDMRNNLKQKINIEFEMEKPPIEKYLEIACKGIRNDLVRRLADSTLYEEHETIDSLVDNLKFQSNGIRQRRKQFEFGDLSLQLYRMFMITFVAEYRNFLMQFPFFFFMITITATFFDQNITHTEVCYSFDHDGTELLNVTCRDKLHAEALTENHKMNQWLNLTLISISIMCMSSLFFNPLLKVFRNEHRNQWYSLGTFYCSFTIVRFIEMTIVACFIGTVAYFSIDHLYIDHYQMNWYRFGNFIYFIWLNNCFQQSFGYLICLIFLDKVEVAVLTSYLLVISEQFFTGYMFNPYKMKNMPSLFLRLSELLSFKTSSDGLMYTIYALNRCEDETNVSFVLDDFGVNVKTVYNDSYFLMINIILVRLLSFIIMIFHFSGFIKTINFKKSTKSDSIKSINYGELSSSEENIENLNKTVRIKKEEELGFEDFSRNKIIVAW
ncbi:hypothetical protein BLA29_005076, partial [Euroglyphus maynei]